MLHNIIERIALPYSGHDFCLISAQFINHN